MGSDTYITMINEEREGEREREREVDRDIGSGFFKRKERMIMRIAGRERGRVGDCSLDRQCILNDT